METDTSLYLLPLLKWHVRICSDSKKIMTGKEEVTGSNPAAHIKDF